MKWISVATKLPKVGVPVLGAIFFEYTNAPSVYSVTAMSFNGFNWNGMREPAFWMYYPKPPKEKP